MSRHNNTSQRIRVGLMGFGRVGRSFYRQATANPQIEVPVICDVGRPEILHYLLLRDTIHGPFRQKVQLNHNQLRLEDGRSSEIILGLAPGDVPWKNYNVDLVIDATGKYLRKSHMEAHLASGAKRVILTRLPEEELDRLVVVGVNENTIAASDRMVSAGSATTAPVALMLKIMDEQFGIDRAMMTAIHAFTGDQPLTDSTGSDLLRSRSGAKNIVPNDTHTPKWVEAILPQLKGKLDGIALNAPVVDGSCVDITYQFKQSGATIENVNNAMIQAAKQLQDIIEVTDDPIVSSDVIGNSHSLLFDSKATMVSKGRLAKTISWYDNSWGHAARVLDIITAYAQLDKKEGAA